MKNVMVAVIWLGIGMLAAGRAAADLDVVFLLDTTGSMASEIREAKERVVQLSSALSESRKGETVRFGVVAYRDRGDEYLTKLSPLSADVLESERFLGVLDASGGGDESEDVLTGLQDALHKMPWKTGKGTERQIFLIGDAPPHLDYADGPNVQQLLLDARKQRIVVNAIGCRSLSQEGISFFRKLAFSTEGTYQHIGSVNATEGGLADVMLKALTTQSGAADFSGAVAVALVPLGGKTPSESQVIVVQHERETVLEAGTRRCTISVQWPRGTGPGRTPEALLHNGALVLLLDVTGGDGGTQRYALPDCKLESAPIQVRIGGAK